MRSVHPRACGEHALQAVEQHEQGGSSPRLRGTLARDDGRIQVLRFIPAPAGNTRRPRGSSSGRPVHPRACGEHVWTRCCAKPRCGSSPRLRGTRAARLAATKAVRFIPAPAGNTTTGRRRSTTTTVHPRACGEHFCASRVSWCLVGSSPRLRGTHGERPARCGAARFIPAPAGNTRLMSPRVCSKAVHPRACGEHPTPSGIIVGSTGSSPRLRGTHESDYPLQGIRRFIPAPAGNTRCAYRSVVRISVHPRACGEHPSTPTTGTMPPGSSPRLRGTQTRSQPRGDLARFIPAPAGNTPSGNSRVAPKAVHPRACGEHTCRLHSSSHSVGSSPRLRGTHPVAGDDVGPARFIPAPAGNTCAIASRQSVGPVHPRACGEHQVKGEISVIDNGSSPRLRGTRAAQGRAARPDRFIPAPAGNTEARLERAPHSSVHPRACGEHRVAAFQDLHQRGSSPRLRGTPEGSLPDKGCARFIPAPAGNTRRRRSLLARRTVHPRACGEHLGFQLPATRDGGSSPRLRGTLFA